MRSAAALVLWATALGSQTLTVIPPRALMDESVLIRAAGLNPGERVSIEASLIDGADHRWAARAEFDAAADGTVAVDTQAPVKGSYKGVSAMGLIWSMMPESKDARRYQPPHQMGIQPIEFRLLRGGQTIAAAHLDQSYTAPGVTRVPLHEGDLRGILFVPPGTEPHPAVMVMSGSNGGVPTRQAAWLASRGFVALALAYFRYEDLPRVLEAIPLEYFGRALEWLSKLPEVARGRIAMMGSSRGGELALQLASMYNVRAVVAYVPASVRVRACCGGNAVPWAWTWKGQPLAFVQRPADRRGSEGMRAAIAVENTQGPVLVISGEDDHLWPSADMGDEVIARLKRQHFPYSFENLKYKGAGHDAGQPGIAPAWHGVLRNPISGRDMDLGGSAAADAASTLDAMPKVLEFLRQSLR